MFNLDILSQQTSNTSNILEYSCVEESYFISTLEFIKESNNEFRQINMNLYKSILESGNDINVINESFSSFLESVNKIIDKFIKFIRSLFEKFIIHCNKFISSDKYILKNKDSFKYFSADNKFNISGYNYTILPSIPMINAKARFEESFVKLNFEELGKITDQKELLEKISQSYSELANELNIDYYNRFRGEVIGKKYVEQSEYADTLFKIYRDGASSKEDITVDESFVIMALSRFEDYKTMQKQVKQLKDNIEKDYDEVKRQVQSIIKRNSDGDVNKLIAYSVNSDYDKAGTGILTLSPEVMNKIDLFTKAKVTQVVEMSNIHSLAFSYKLDAIKDCYKQDKEVLYTALLKASKNK